MTAALGIAAFYALLAVICAAGIALERRRERDRRRREARILHPSRADLAPFEADLADIPAEEITRLYTGGPR